MNHVAHRIAEREALKVMIRRLQLNRCLFCSMEFLAGTDYSLLWRWTHAGGIVGGAVMDRLHFLDGNPDNTSRENVAYVCDICIRERASREESL